MTISYQSSGNIPAGRSSMVRVAIIRIRRGAESTGQNSRVWCGLTAVRAGRDNDTSAEMQLSVGGTEP